MTYSKEFCHIVKNWQWKPTYCFADLVQMQKTEKYSQLRCLFTKAPHRQEPRWLCGTIWPCSASRKEGWTQLYMMELMQTKALLPEASQVYTAKQPDSHLTMFRDVWGAAFGYGQLSTEGHTGTHSPTLWVHSYLLWPARMAYSRETHCLPVFQLVVFSGMRIRQAHGKSAKEKTTTIYPNRKGTLLWTTLFLYNSGPKIK